MLKSFKLWVFQAKIKIFLKVNTLYNVKNCLIAGNSVVWVFCIALLFNCVIMIRLFVLINVFRRVNPCSFPKVSVAFIRNNGQTEQALELNFQFNS